jgi:radical SAM domain protein
LGPVLPYLTDSLENLQALLADCVDAKVYGVLLNGFGVTLRAGASAYFFSCLRELSPELPEAYEALLPPGKVGKTASFLSPNAAALAELFGTSTAACGLVTDPEELFAFRHAFQDRRSGQQLSLFDLYDL